MDCDSTDFNLEFTESLKMSKSFNTDTEPDEYREWKGWKDLYSYNIKQANYFSGEMKGLNLVNAKLLEIGFGQGSFLRWCRDRGAVVVGYELIQSICEVGNSQGFDVRHGDFRVLLELTQETFDLIVAFDVFEHIPADQIQDVFTLLRKKLNANGVIVVRVPNGQSPFGLAYQHGDITHINCLSKTKFQQISLACKLNLVSCENQYRANVSKPRILGKIKFLCRDLIAYYIQKIYDLDRMPFDSNIVARFKLKE